MAPVATPLVDTPAHLQFRFDVDRLVEQWRSEQHDRVVDVRDRILVSV